jgi:hypothetical protein
MRYTALGIAAALALVLAFATPAAADRQPRPWHGDGAHAWRHDGGGIVQIKHGRDKRWRHFKDHRHPHHFRRGHHGRPFYGRFDRDYDHPFYFGRHWRPWDYGHDRFYRFRHRHHPGCRH